MTLMRTTTCPVKIPKPPLLPWFKPNLSQLPRLLNKRTLTISQLLRKPINNQRRTPISSLTMLLTSSRTRNQLNSPYLTTMKMSTSLKLFQSNLWRLKQSPFTRSQLLIKNPSLSQNLLPRL